MSRTNRKSPYKCYGSFRGGTLMAPSQCGLWNDERDQTGPDRRRQKRAIKRGKANTAWKREINS